MASKLGKFQLRGFTGWADITRDNHLSAMWQRQPQRATDVMIQLLAYNHGTSLESFLNQFPTKVFDDDTDFYWDVLASAARNIPLLEARKEDGVTVVASTDGNIGVGGVPFYLVFGEKWFFDGETIVGNYNEVYPMRILEEPRLEGTNVVYKVQLHGNVMNGIPASRLLAGERFSYEYAPVETEGSRKVGGVRHTMPVAMRNGWSQIRKSHKVFGNKMDRKVAMGIPMVRQDASGKQVHDTANYWMHYEDYEYELEWQQEKNRLLAFSRDNSNANHEYTDFGKSGGVIRMGDGIFAQTEYANVMYYNDTTGVMKLIMDALSEMSEGKLLPQQRKFIINTGERGALIFNREAKRESSGWLPLYTGDNNPAAIAKVAANFTNGNAVKITDFQITEWQAPNGVYVKLNVDPFYDDKVRNKIYHPEGGVAFSYRFDIWYLGTDGSTPNIQKAACSTQPELRSYEPGIRNPWTGERNLTYASNDEDACTVHTMFFGGAIVYDPTKCVSIIPSILRAA